MDKISYPLMGDYSVPTKYLLTHILNIEVITPPPITSKTIALGSKYSPDIICTPFKYTLGTMLESVEKGANILIQLGGGCRYGYYAYLQEQILKDLNKDVKIINLVTKGKLDAIKIYKELKKISKINIFKTLYHSFITIKMVKYMDQIDAYIRENIGFEQKKGSFELLKYKMLKDFSTTTSYKDLKRKYKYYNNKIKSVQVRKPENRLKVGIIGELYTVMEPYANYDLEKSLANHNIEIKRFTNAHYLLIEKKREVKHYLKYAKEYIKYKMGADAADNICRTKYLCEQGYDGIIHIKSSFCTPEIGAMPIISKIADQYNVPVLFLTLDIHNGEEGIKTRLEAFYDMLEMRKTK